MYYCGDHGFRCYGFEEGRIVIQNGVVSDVADNAISDIDSRWKIAI